MDRVDAQIDEELSGLGSVFIAAVALLLVVSVVAGVIIGVSWVTMKVLL